jgi:Tetratricopeptide repeat
MSNRASSRPPSSCVGGASPTQFDPGAYRPYVAGTPNNLGILYSDTGRNAEAEKAFTEALATYRELAACDPGAADRPRWADPE